GSVFGCPPVPDLSVVVLSWNTKDDLRTCLDALRRGRGGLTVEVVCIDNASSDGSADMTAAEFPEVRLVRNAENVGYARGVNQGLRAARGYRICLLGSDTRVAPDALPKLCAFLDAHPEVGAVAPRLVNFDDGATQRACMRFPRLRTALWWDTPLQAWFPESRELRRYRYRDFDHESSRAVEQPPGTCLVLRRDVVDRLGPMDERLWLFFNDVDWSMRLDALGLKSWYLADAVVAHREGGSTRKFADFGAEWHRNRIALYRKHWGLAGAALTKAVLCFVALRQCFRVKRDLGSWRAAAPHAAEIRRTLRRLLRKA
ncbi:MAG TPA: glycosyltransferase family 2 protein, partial [Planctomycetota bacterium]|nr:glycosyltransferase family 2 protein [Planctomycetota bacterium]